MGGGRNGSANQAGCTAAFCGDAGCASAGPALLPCPEMEDQMNEAKRLYQRRSLDELNVLDDFLMSAAASDPEDGPEFCRLLLSTLLERPIGQVKVSAQKLLNSYTPELHGVRLDVEVIEPLGGGGPVANIYDIEPCLYVSPLETLIKRNRYYQGRIDGQYLKSGERDYSRLPNLYVITILPYDPFGQDFMVYPFQNMCRELPELDYPDGLRYIYFNTKGTKGGSPAIRELLDYLQKSTKENAKNETLLTLHHHIEKVKGYQEVKDRFMTVGDVIEHVKDDTRKEDIFELLKDYGKIPDKIRERIENEFNPDILKRWHKLAARCGSMEAFEEQM